ncbi:MAG TPA: ATP-binding protein [Pseudonocardia sp.]
MRQQLPVDLSAPCVARRLVRRWLTALGCGEPEIDDLVLATNEAVSNAVDHAYPSGDLSGGISVQAELLPHGDGAHQVVITVADGGVWQPMPAVRGYRGRGLLLMRALTESLELHNTGAGTRVRMTSRPLRLIGLA